MIITNFSPSNLPLLDIATLNPAFFGATVNHGAGGKTYWVNPAAVIQPVTVQPAPVIQDGIVVDFPPYTELVTVYPPAKQVTVPGTGDTIKNSYDSVGIINPGGQIRLCALVRPDVIAAAHHYNNAPYQPYIGMEVRFIGQFGIETARIAAVVFTRDDFECYRLDRAITVVPPAPVAGLESVSAYSSRSVICFGLSEQARPAACSTVVKYAFPSGAGWLATVSNRPGGYAVVERGDSGSPVFIVSAGVAKYFGSLAAINLTQFTINMAPPWMNDLNSL